MVAPAAIGEELHRARLRAHLSTEELASRAGVDASEVAAVEAGRPARVPSVVEFLADVGSLANTLDIAGESLIEETLSQWASNFAEDRGIQGEGSTTAQSPTEIWPAATTERALEHRGLGRSERQLRRWVVIAIVALAAASLALALVEAGAVGGHPAGAPRGGTAPSTPTALFTQTGAGPGVATYVTSATSLSVSVAATRPAWVEVRASNRAPMLAGVVPAGTTPPIMVSVPFTVQIGAGGATVVISGGGRHQDLTPPSAPFTFNVLARSG